MLQAASMAEGEGSPDSLVVAALLHDIGHLVHHLPEDIAERGVDGHHEDAGASWLAPYFPPEVIRPIEMHVRRQAPPLRGRPGLCRGALPRLEAQPEVAGRADGGRRGRAVESDPHHRSAIRLRGWDDAAKVVGLEVPPLEHYRGRLEAARIGD